MKIGKVLITGLMLATVAGFLPVSGVSAQTAGAVRAGSLMKASGSAVYYYALNGKRYVFPNEKTYFTWYSDFSGVQTITDAELASYPIGGNVTYRPGVKMIKIGTDIKVYAISRGGVLRPIISAPVAECLYGRDWQAKIDVTPDAFFVNYTVGSLISTCSSYVPATETSGTLTIDQNLNLAN
jgi:hypothetical protein